MPHGYGEDVSDLGKSTDLGLTVAWTRQHLLLALPSVACGVNTAKQTGPLDGRPSGGMHIRAPGTLG